MSNEDNRACLGTIGLIVAPWKFDILQTSIIVLEASLPSRANICCKNIKISAGQLSVIGIVPRQNRMLKASRRPLLGMI